MSDRKQVSRNKTTASNFSNPSLAQNTPSLANPTRGFGVESHQTTPPTLQLETSPEVEQIADEQQNQEHISLKESAQGLAFNSTNYLQRVSVRPRQTVHPQAIDVLEVQRKSIQRQELEDGKEEELDQQEDSQQIQAKLNPYQAESKPASVSEQLSKNFQLQLKQEDKLDKPIKSFNLLERATSFRPQETLQRQELEEEKEEQEQQEGELVQTKLTVGKPGDKYEQEADATAAKVMAMSDATLQRQTEEETEETQPQENPNLNPASINGTEQEVQTKAKGNHIQANSDLESRLGSSKGGGSPLSDDVRGFMEPRFGADFSNVRVHTDSSAVQMNKELGAQAFAHGNDIYYGGGKSPGNNELTAHELTHTIQQTGGKLQPKFINQIAKKENKLHTSAVFPVQMKEVPVEGEVDRASPDSVENPQKEQQAGSGVSSTKEEKNSTSPQNKDGTTPQQNAAVTGENPTSPQETTKEETNPAGDNFGGNSQQNQQASSKQGGDKQSNTAATPEKTSAKTAPASPDSDPDFQAVVGKAKGVANKEKKHEPANKKSQEAQDAAQSPASEVESKAQGNQVAEMEQAPTPAFNAAAFKNKLMERIREAAPQNLDQADKFKDNNKLGSVKSEMQETVKQEQTASQTPLEEKAKQAPDTSGIEPKSVTPLPPNEAGTATENIGAQKAIPKPKGQGEVEAPLQESSQKLDQQMADANITEKQLAKSNEPQFQTALAAKQKANANANQAPQQYRQFEQNQLTQAKEEASASTQQQLQGMHGDRAQLLSQVTNQQVVAKGTDEQERAKIAGDIQGIYQNTKTSVDGILKGIEGEVIKRFEAGTGRAKEAYENYVAPHMEDYKTRYDGIWGAGRWVKDKLLGVPPEVTTFFNKGRDKYLNEMDTTLTDIANYVTEQLNLAKEKIAEGRKEIKKYVEGLPASLQQVGQDAANNIQDQFDQLEQSVDDKQNQLIDTLSQAYTKNLEEMDARIKEMKASNQPWFAKAFDGLTGVIETINKLKNMLMKVLAKVADTVGNIIQDPISFLGNLISGIKQGFENFVGNIGKHLQSGLIGWLTGALGPMGIQLPDDIFSLPGIFSLVTQVLGLTFNHIRAKAVKQFGEPVVVGMEKGVEIFQILRDRKAMGLWEHVKEQFNDLKETVIEEIKNMVITQVITAGVKWIIGLLNPASAFVKAAMAIYDIIMFFVNRGSQVLELVNSVVDAVAAIASGAVGGAAKLVENALSRALPVVIGFLASVAGIGGLAKKVEGIIGKIRKRVDKAIDKVILKAKGLFKGKKGKDNKDKDGQFTQKDKDAGLAAFEKQEKPFVKNGAITQADARKVGKIVKNKHPVFESITVVDGKDSWNYKYIFRSDDVDTTSKKSETTQSEFPPQIKIGNRIESQSSGVISKIISFDQSKDLITLQINKTVQKRSKLSVFGEKLKQGELFITDKPEVPEEVQKLEDEIQELLKDPLLKPGPFAKESIPSTGPTVSKNESKKIQPIGNKYGCHSTGVTEPGGNGTWIGDHQPATELVNHGLASGPQRLYPHSWSASGKQGNKVKQILKKNRELQKLKGK